MTDLARPSAFVDRFVLHRLPPRELWPETGWAGVADPAYPPQFNSASVLLDHWVESGQGDRILFHHADGEWTYRRVHEAANRIAGVLVAELGLVPGGRVLLRAPNHPMLVACWFAVLKAGGVAVTTMPLLRPRELSEIIERADIGLALVDSRGVTDLATAWLARPSAQLVCFNTAAADGLDARMRAYPPAFSNVLTSAEDPAIVAFTSGTTGRAKGTVHFHRDLLAVTDTYGRQVLKPEPGDVFIGSPPLAFTYGLGGLVLFPMRFGASTALLEQASPSHLLEGIERHRATVTVTSPTAYRAMVERAGEFDLSSLRCCLSAGETLPAPVFEAWERATGVRLMDGIGSTELLHVFIGSTAADARAGSTGRVVPGYQARVVDDEGREVPRGSVGRLAVRGPTGCRYLDDVENQRKYVQGGWNLTGDAYVTDEEGYFWYRSRTDDMIISSGYNISGAEVESVLLRHSAVAECAVVGVADEARGHVVKAFVVPATGVTASDELAKALQDFVKSELAPYKYPRAVQFVSALPRTLTGKVQRFRLRSVETGELAAASPRSLSGPAVHEPEGWARPVGYANAVSARGRTVFVAGQVGWDPATGAFPSLRFPDQVRQALRNIVAALAAAGARPDHITRLTWYITNREGYLTHRREFGASYREIIGRHFPAMSVVVVAGLIEPGAEVEIEATAVIPDGSSSPPAAA